MYIQVGNRLFNASQYVEILTVDKLGLYHISALDKHYDGRTLGVFKTKEKRDKVFEELVRWLANDGTYIPFSDRPNFVIQDKVFRMPIEEE